MKDLNLPIIKGEDIINKKSLSMEEYLRFVEFNLKYTIDIPSARRCKKDLVVDVPFFLK